MKEAIKAWLDANVDFDWCNLAEAAVISYDSEAVTSLIEECMADIGPKWISVNEALPIDGERVLISDNEYVGHAYMRNGEWYIVASNDHVAESAVPYWMHKPEPKE